MIKNFNKDEQRKKDAKILLTIIFVFLIVVWLCTPPGNKFLQICFWGNNTKFLIAKLQNNDELTAYKFHRNNAVYLAKMGFKDKAIGELYRAAAKLPNYVSERDYDNLYRDSAQVRLFFGDYKGALNDYLKVKGLYFTDRLPLAALLRVNGNHDLALQQCNLILNTDFKAYAGYACIADVYGDLGRYDAAVRVYDLLIDKSPRARYYADRAVYKRKLGDYDGYYKDLETAKNDLPNIKEEENIIYQTLNPRVLKLNNWKI